jgi:hypothetical protein
MKSPREAGAGRKVIRADRMPTLARALGVGVMELFQEEERK